MVNGAEPTTSEWCGTDRGRRRHERLGETVSLCPLCTNDEVSAEALDLPERRSQARHLICEWCDKAFTTEQPTRRYCSDECRALARTERRRQQRS